MEAVRVLVCQMSVCLMFISLVKADCLFYDITIQDIGGTETGLVLDLHLMEGERHQVLNGAILICEDQTPKACHRKICITIGEKCHTVYIDKYGSTAPSCEKNNIEKDKLGLNSGIIWDDTPEEILSDPESPHLPPLLR